MWSLLVWAAPFVLAYIFLSTIRRWVQIDNINQRYVLVTGCDHGYGHLLVQRLDLLGCRVFAACASENAKNRLQQMTSSRLRAFTLDVTSDHSIKQAVNYIKVYIPEGEGLWALVNNAETSGSVIGPIEWHSMNDIGAVMETNVLSMIRVTISFLPLLKRAKGRIITLSSVHGRVTRPLYVPYGMSKAAVEAFSDGIRPHLRQYDVSVHVIEPGNFQTDMAGRQRARKAVQWAWRCLPWHLREEFGEPYMETVTAHVTGSVDKASPKINDVIKAYVHAITAKCPRDRYTAGNDARFFWLPLSYAPSAITDAILSRWSRDLVPACLQPKPKPEVKPEDKEKK